MTTPSSSAPLMLGVSGLRGIVGASLTPEVTVRYAGSLAVWLRRSRRDRPGRPSVVVGMDGRRGGMALMHLVAHALQAAGCDVLIVGTAMTPSIGFLVDHTGADAGLVVTASHNPQEWNGLKIIVRDAEGRASRTRSGRAAPAASAPSSAWAEEIIEIYKGGGIEWQPPEGFGEYLPRVGGVLPEAHESAVVNLLKESGDLRRLRRRKFTVALDTVNGSGAVWGGRFLEELGCEVRELYPIRKDGKNAGIFPHEPEPTRANLEALCRATKRWKADVGFALDPDGDRLAIVDERGRYIGEEYTLALAAESLLRQLDAGKRGSRPQRKGSRGGQRILVTNLSTSRMLDDIAAKHSAAVLRTPVGEANVVEVMKREGHAGDVILGGEGNGGVIWPRVTYIRDSLSAMALVLSLMAGSGISISELVAELPSYTIDKRKVDLARRDDAQPAIEKLAAAYGDQQIDRQDGIRIDFPARRAWLHVRPSNTEPIMRLIAEAPTADEASAILDEAEEVAGLR